jgi:hypothetical protein
MNFCKEIYCKFAIWQQGTWRERYRRCPTCGFIMSRYWSSKWDDRKDCIHCSEGKSGVGYSIPPERIDGYWKRSSKQKSLIFKKINLL